MYPWFLWRWAPTFEFPFSGDIAQHIAPETDWFTDNVNPEVGDPDIERNIFHNVASYGRQLGLITEVLLALTLDKDEPTLADLVALQRLKEIQTNIELIKVEHSRDLRIRAERTLDQLAAEDPAAFDELIRRKTQALR